MQAVEVQSPAQIQVVEPSAVLLSPVSAEKHNKEETTATTTKSWFAQECYDIFKSVLLYVLYCVVLLVCMMVFFNVSTGKMRPVDKIVHKCEQCKTQFECTSKVQQHKSLKRNGWNDDITTLKPCCGFTIHGKYRNFCSLACHAQYRGSISHSLID